MQSKEELEPEENQDEEDVFWTTYAIKYWMQEWYEQKPMTSWTIGNHDGRESYQDLGISLTKEHQKGDKLEPVQFKRMRRCLTILEGEVGEVLNGPGMTGYDRKMEWHKLKNLAISVCNDYTPEVLQAMEVKKATANTRGSRPTEVRSNNHAVDTRYVGRSHVDCATDREKESQRFGCCNDSNGDIEDIKRHNKVWRPQRQTHHDRTWSATSCQGDTEPMVGCLKSGSGRGRMTQPRQEDEDSEGEVGDLACNMTGHAWESLPFPIVIDSGACASVMPAGWCNYVPFRETPQSKAGAFYRAANGNRIYHEGERIVSMMIQEMSLRDMKFAVCDVTKALGSVSQMCRTGHKVVSNPPWSPHGSYKMHEETGGMLIGSCTGVDNCEALSVLVSCLIRFSR